MTALDPDRTLALSYVPAERREAVFSLWRLDVALGAVVSGGREPMISRIKLAWWREALEKLDTAPAPAEPALQALAAHVLPRGICGAELAAMEEGWAALLAEEALSDVELQTYAAARGGTLFGLSARLLGSEADRAHLQAGEGWALADLARHSGDPDAGAALAAARERRSVLRWPASLRPIGMLAVLAQRDAERGLAALEPQGAPARMLRMLRHRLTGR
ncbi:MAG TPA: squalene/phytoene synthase family protein [Allosphingosinicella sp.]|nr:squalene/phytoene synthase family protein [Allosphingosinicella sp.]